MAKRRRATVLARRDGCYLLVRERGQKQYGLPGGGIEKGEPTLLAAVREMHEETRLGVSAIRFIGELDGSWARHYVFVADVYGHVRLQRKELSEHRWWDLSESLPVQGHVRGALDLLKQAETDPLQAF